MSDVNMIVGAGVLGALIIGYLLGRLSTRSAVLRADKADSEISGLETQLETLDSDKSALRKSVTQLKDANGIKVQELATLNLRLDAAEIMRTDYKRAKVRGGEANQLRKQVSNLESELSSIDTTEDLTPLGDDVDARDSARSLHEAVSSLLNEEVLAAMIVDGSGLQIVSAGLADDAMAAYSVLLGEACSRATYFVPIGDPYRITLVDESGSRVSLWPFNVGEQPMALLTVSKQPPATAAVNVAISKVKALMPKSFRVLSGSDS